MEVKLIRAENGIDFKLCNDMGIQIARFDVELNKETALISYETEENFRNQGYASKGLILLRDTLFSEGSILFLELINLSGDYSRKVAENAEFFSRSNNLNYYICLNPDAEQIVNDKLYLLDSSSIEYKRMQKLLKKVQALKCAENRAKLKMQEKLDKLLELREQEDSKDYMDYIESEINHLKKLLPDLSDKKSYRQ